MDNKSEEITLTQEELDLLSPFNSCAYALHKKSLNDSIPPAWLCMSDTARKRARDNLLAEIHKQLPGDKPDAEIETYFNKISEIDLSIQTSVQGWRDFELALKRERALNNPLAFFCE